MQGLPPPPPLKRQKQPKVTKLIPKRKRLSEEVKKVREEQKKLTYDIKHAQRKVARLQKKREAVAEKRNVVSKLTGDADGTPNNKVIDDEQLELIPEDIRDDAKVIFRPNAGPQTDFLAASENEVFYGGARGGGKSYSLLVDPLRYCTYDTHRALILRRTMPELRDLINHSHKLYPKAFPGAQWREKESLWRFPSGARIEFGYAENRQDALRYQGQAYTWIGIDELPQYPDVTILNDLRGSLRSVDPAVPTFLRACVDEGDVLTEHGWKPIQEVKRGEFVQSLNKDGNIILKEVLDIYKYEVNEPIARIKTRGLYMSMTNDHRIVYSKSPKSHDICIDRFNQVDTETINIYRTGYGYDTIRSYSGETLGLDSKLYLEILGYFLSEGCATTRNRVNIAQKKPVTRAIIKKALDKTGLNWRTEKSGFTLNGNLEWHKHFSQFGKCLDKFIPRIVLETANYEELDILLNALILGDGHRSEFKYVEYYTISKQLWDDVAEIAVKIGYKVWQRFRDRPEYGNNRSYELSIRRNNTATSEIYKKSSKLELYSGKVYCLSVADTHNFVLRQKGGVWISANTGNP